ncbi:hypothetical protein FJY90_03640 [Candidatus Gottesmanbacteria bacterium]|nr:hypothetical protein [Candidatus Gottesmanbacteria bacterium]
MKSNKYPFNIVLIIIAIFLAAIQVFLLNTYSTTGKDLTRMSEEIQDTERENSRLSQKIASASSLMTISKKAQQLGFVYSSSVISLTSPQPLAYSPETSF